MLRILVLIGLFFFAINSLQAQVRTCGTVELQKLNKTEEQIQLEQDRFESWLSTQVVKSKNTSALESLDEETIYQIPVVVHIIHRGEPEGSGTNIPDEQVFAQIEALNLDFRHLNADSTNTPFEFQDLMADIAFEFVLAKRNPNGFKTDGITRTNGGATEWTYSDNDELKALSYWSSEDYLNIWVGQLADGLLGWAEFPTSTILAGVNDYATDNPLTDGVVITTEAFGSETLYPDGNYLTDFNEGRTLTHELGHFFGLRHIWGDGDCSDDDYVDDTPLTYNSYSSCPNLGEGYLYSCNNELSMFMNYMDYVDDACMNLFTLGQKERMQIVVNNSPRRASLLTSEALIPPPPLEITAVRMTDPGEGTCTALLNPAILVRNDGSTTITEVEMSFSLDGSLVESKGFSLTLEEDDSIELYFSALALPDFGSYQLDIEIDSVNGGIDDNTDNNIVSQQVNYSKTVSELSENFSAWPEDWAIRSAAPLAQWNYSKAINFSMLNTSASLLYYDNASAYEDQLTTPTLDLTTKNSAFLLFDYSYVNREEYSDLLYVTVSTDCGNSFGDTLFINNGITSRQYSSPVSYAPSGPVDWQTVALDLSAYVGQPVQVAFNGKSAGGNNIYIDNIKLVEDSYSDLAIKGLVNEAGAYPNQTEPSIWIENTGVKEVNSVEISIESNSSSIFSKVYNDLSLTPGSRIQLETPLNMDPGTYDLTFEIDSPDDNNENNTYEATVHIIQNNELIPFREYFSSLDWNDQNSWTISSPGDDVLWSYGDEYLGIQSFGIGNKGVHDWLVLPNLNFSSATEAGLRFKLSYSENNYNAELLRIWVSTNNGQTFDDLLISITGDDLVTAPLQIDHTPESDDEWQLKFVDLSEYAGNESVLLGFEATDNDGNNIYLDNIEIFISADAEVIELDPGKMAIYPNPITGSDSNITFSLNKKEDIQVRIIDAQGNIVSDQYFTGVVNQTYPIDLTEQRNGLYIIQAIGSTFANTKRIMLSR